MAANKALNGKKKKKKLHGVHSSISNLSLISDYTEERAATSCEVITYNIDSFLVPECSALTNNFWKVECGSRGTKTIIQGGRGLCKMGRER